MEKRALPTLRALSRPQGFQWEISPRAFEHWVPTLSAAASGDNATISILDFIGADMFGEGVTAKRIAAALRAIGPRNDVTVHINSPGGDLFEGTTIYNLFREHEGNVTVKVLGLAASAASIVAMAGDRVEIARSGAMMIHNTWAVVMGNRNDLRETADTLETLDGGMAGVYALRTGLDDKQIRKLMDADTWFGGADAIDRGFADDFLPADQIKEDGAPVDEDRAAAFAIDKALALGQPIPRGRRRELMQRFKSGTPCAAGAGTPRATEDDTPCAVVEDWKRFCESFSIKGVL